jgi:hypothetical protein
MVPGDVPARYEFPFILEGVLELEVVKRALISPKKRGSLKMRIKTASCPGIGQARPISGTFKHVFTQDEHVRRRCAMCAVSDRNCLVRCPGYSCGYGGATKIRRRAKTAIALILLDADQVQL